MRAPAAATTVGTAATPVTTCIRAQQQTQNKNNHNQQTYTAVRTHTYTHARTKQNKTKTKHDNLTHPGPPAPTKTNKKNKITCLEHHNLNIFKCPPTHPPARAPKLRLFHILSLFHSFIFYHKINQSI